MENMVNIYIFGVFSEKSYSKPSKCNVVYIPITRKSVHRTRMPPLNAIQKKGLYVTVTGIP